MSAPRGHRFYGNQYKKAGGGGGKSSGRSSGSPGVRAFGRTKRATVANAKVGWYSGKRGRPPSGARRVGALTPGRKAAKLGMSASRYKAAVKELKAKGMAHVVGGRLVKTAKGAAYGKRKGAYATGKLHSKSALPGRVGSIHSGTRRGASKLNQGQRVSLGKSRARRARKAA